MKTRYKKAKRILTFYYNNFGLKPPYHVLLCGTFCKQALVDRINIAEQLPKYLSAEVKLLTTKCAIKECELGGSLLFGPYKVLRQFDMVECHHAWFKGGAKCLHKTAQSHKTKYLIATQDRELAAQVHEHNVPVLHIAHNAINLEAPSHSSKASAEEKTSQKLTITASQEQSIKKLKQELGVTTEEDLPKKKKRKRKGGPNPLSCKKRKKNSSITSSSAVHTEKKQGKKKKRLNTTTNTALS